MYTTLKQEKRMEKIKIVLFGRAHKQFGRITPCQRPDGSIKTWDECFAVICGKVTFWFNDGKNTRMLMEDENCQF